MAWMKATPRTPCATARMVAVQSFANSSPRPVPTMRSKMDRVLLAPARMDLRPDTMDRPVGNARPRCGNLQCVVPHSVDKLMHRTAQRTQHRQGEYQPGPDKDIQRPTREAPFELGSGLHCAFMNRIPSLERTREVLEQAWRGSGAARRRAPFGKGRELPCQFPACSPCFCLAAIRRNWKAGELALACDEGNAYYTR